MKEPPNCLNLIIGLVAITAGLIIDPVAAWQVIFGTVYLWYWWLQRPENHQGLK